MARIKTYTIDTLITDNDIVIGSDSDNLSQTKNYKASDLRGYVLSGLDPETGGNLKITTLTATSNVYLTPNGYVNNLNPAIEVLNYEIIFLILNGRTYIFRRNGDTFGVGETQTSSGDFTEIDITSVINANRQNLDSVLNEGNESFDNNIFINKVYLWDNVYNTDYGCAIEGSKEALNVYKASGSLIVSISDKEIKMKSGIYSYNVIYPSITANRNATFQNASGTVAYLSDIPTVEIQELVDGDNISIESSDGVYTINSNYYNRPYITDIQFRNSLTNTTFFTGGQNYSYNAVSSPINSIRIKFDSTVFKVTTSNVKVAAILIDFEKDAEMSKTRTEILNTNVTLSGDYITFPFDFSVFSNTVGLRPINIKVSLYPDVITNGVEKCDGTISESISNFLNDVLF
jgi:hypothetical protein